jgi:hypothetical protein
MGLNIVLVPQRQSAEGIALSWSATEEVTAYQIFVSQKRLTADELEATALLGGTDECVVAKVGPEVLSVLDDVSPPGEARHYGVAMLFADGSAKAARFKAVADGGTAESFHLSALKARSQTGAYRVKPAAPKLVAAKPASVEPVKFASVEPAEDPLEARKRAQRAARGEPAAAPAADSAAAPPPPSAVPLAAPIDLRMQGATQTWDGLRIYWDRDPKAVAYEIVASDHQVFGDELADALAGTVDFTTASAVAPAVTCVLDNVTPREARGWYAVIARYRDGSRAAHGFQVGDAAGSGRTAGPFLNPNRTGELRAEVEGLLADAREQWERWSTEQDGGARREARRMVADALLIWPGHPGASKLQAEMT